MGSISSLYIYGLKKFKEMEIHEFNKHMNVFVGENEAGKSTILEAIKIVLNQLYKNSDKSILKDLFNLDLVNDFITDPSIKTLPHIIIEVHMELSSKDKGAEYFYGENNRNRSGASGIRFECKFDTELGSGLAKEISEGKIPYEYYTLRWTAFSGSPYSLVRRPFKFLVINTSSDDTNSSFNYFNKALFSSSYDEGVRLKAKNTFRDGLTKAFDEMGLTDLDTQRKFGINDKKVLLESVLSVYENSIALENKGSGMESLIKTQIALDKRKSNLDVIMIEEPENYLSFVTMNKMLQELSRRQSDSQLIITTHSNMIASRLNLRNVLWITDSVVVSLKDIDEDTADFFEKADNNNFLQLLLSTKIILVEGASEAILLPKIYKQLTTRTLEEDGVTVISGGGITYKNYLKITPVNKKRIAVITDNDKRQERIDDAKVFNASSDVQHIFLGETVGEWTWEACLYALNVLPLEKLIKIEKGAKYLFHDTDYGQVLGKMLNNKAETAYEMAKSECDFEIPKYIKDAITWLNE